MATFLAGFHRFANQSAHPLTVFGVESFRVAGNGFGSGFRARDRSFCRVRCVHDFATFLALRPCLFLVRQSNQLQLASLFPFCPEDGLHGCTCYPKDGRLCGANAAFGLPWVKRRQSPGRRRVQADILRGRPTEPCRGIIQSSTITFKNSTSMAGLFEVAPFGGSGRE